MLCLRTQEANLPAYLHYPFNVERQEESCEYQLFKSLGLTQQGIELKSTDYEADALTTSLVKFFYIVAIK